ncbi:glycosyltransferase [Leptobacterium flavescens]|uniref:Glycosyltransferase n=1 Tax=Leptobacterium flavescens TaxID=472055 RepID=A0A6P0UPC4_9FLAO|nr:glycosyltransferase [Leptobacterium flavescens]NER12763.1 glycosyltransferase [Leptobacterium flavescens]
MKAGIITPCYNEENKLQIETYIRFIRTNDNYHLCLVNDGSSDKTSEVLKQIKKAAPQRVSVIDLKENRGKATAVSVGAKYLYEQTDVDYIGYLNADLSTDFNDFDQLVSMLDKTGKLSMVFGSRGYGEGNRESNFIRKFFSIIIKFLVYFTLRLPIEDAQCGAKVFRRNIVPVVFSNPFLCRWLFDVEIFIRLKEYFGRHYVMEKIKEQPLERWVHADDPKLGMKDALQLPYRLLNIGFNYHLINKFQGPKQAYELENIAVSYIIT